jgi:hypothetical protein
MVCAFINAPRVKSVKDAATQNQTKGWATRPCNCDGPNWVSF